jgi:hypothetical protein
MVRLRTVDAFAERPFTGSPAAVLVGVELKGDRATIMGRAVTSFDGALSGAARPGSLLPPAGKEATLPL